jgi:hypothetical protein
MTFHLIDYGWLGWAAAFALLSISTAVVARRQRSKRLVVASALVGLTSAIWLVRFAVHWLVGAQCVEGRCLIPPPYAALLSISDFLAPWLALLGAVVLFHWVLRSPRSA